MGYIKLHPADREKYGVPEEIPFDWAAIGVRQRAALERETKRSYRWMTDQLEGVPELDENQNPIPEPVIDPATGEQKIENGEPVFTPRLKRDGEALAMFVWMAMWGIGVRVPWDTFEIRQNGLEILGDGEGDEGKAEAPETDSASTTNDPS